MPQSPRAVGDADLGQVLRHCVRDEAGPGVRFFEKVPDDVDRSPDVSGFDTE